MDKVYCPPPVEKDIPGEQEPKQDGASMDKTVAHTIVTEVFNFLEVKAAGRTITLMALSIAEQMVHGAIDAGLLEWLKQRESLRQLPEAFKQDQSKPGSQQESVFPPKTSV